MKTTTPTEPGLYLAHCGMGGPEGKREFWTMIAMVHGKYPFFRIIAWEINSNVLDMDFAASKITAWGPKIETEIGTQR